MNDLYGTSTTAPGPCPYKACSKECFSCTCLNLHSSEERTSVGRMLPSSTQQGIRSARYSPNFMCVLLMKKTSYEVSGIYFYVYCKIDPWLQTYYCWKIFLSELIQRKNIQTKNGTGGTFDTENYPSGTQMTAVWEAYSGSHWGHPWHFGQGSSTSCRATSHTTRSPYPWHSNSTPHAWGQAPPPKCLQTVSNVTW